MFRNDLRYSIVKKGGKGKVYFKIGPFRLRVKKLADIGQATKWVAKRCCKERKCFHCKGKKPEGCAFCVIQERNT